MVREFAEEFTKERTHLVMLVLLERDNFCVNSVISLTSYAVVCSYVVVHNSDHNCYGRYCGLLQHRRYGAAGTALARCYIVKHFNMFL